MATPSIRILVVDDFEPFRQFVRSTLQDKLGLVTILEASDGVEAVGQALALQPELILLDIGLPKLNGIDAARKICDLVPRSKILFVSQESSLEVVQAAFRAGASGYVVKIDAGSELPTAVKAVLRGERFVGIRFAGQGFPGPSHARDLGSALGNQVFIPLPRQDVATAHRHEAGFYSNDRSLLVSFTQFIGASLKEGNAAIVVATQSHRNSLLFRLQARGLDMGAAIEQGRYISLDAADMLSTIMIDDLPDPVRFLQVASDLIMAAAKASKGEHRRVAICGECDPPLWKLGKGEAAIQLEQLWNELGKTHAVDILCGYPLSGFYDEQDSHIFQRICAAHSAVYSH